MEQLKIGDYTLTWLDGGVTTLDGGAMFGVVPKALWSKKYHVNEKNQIVLRTDPILIQGNGKNFLIESGVGNGKFSEKQLRNYGITSESRLNDSLEALGLTPEDIDSVLMTHMHFDHASGLSRWNENNELISVFPNADIITSALEWDEMRHPNIRSKNTYWPQNWQPIAHQVKTYVKEEEVFKGIKMHQTGGHSNGHSIITIESQGDKMIHMADIMPTHAHKNVLWVLAYDDYPMDSIRAKQKWMAYGAANNTWYTFYHDNVYRALKWNDNGEVSDAIERK